MEKILFSVLMAYLVVAAVSESSLKEVFSKYKFHYKTGDSGEHTRTEESDESGRVIGMYSYKDPNGVLRTVRYNAAPELGYQAYGEGFPQFGNAPFGYYTNGNPTYLPATQLNAEDKSNETFPEDYEAQASEVSTVTESPIDGITSTTPAPRILSEIESESSTEVMESSTEPSTVSPDTNNNRLVPVLLPYGSFHKILIHSGHFYYPVPHALAYSLVAPNYQMVL
ncbi:hypothetical protein AVEN_246482-1 [Araneus ventricosus]|uniref:Cuticle protein 6 n=1 Tax=Araneus ventricosus TaxID=182803 RepID=A0A4Y2V604_ARAVE|nr:hypothetical protein AVEN_246482-1 [Araneus ventricosus]